jgi:bromodomain-containing protein 8
MEQLEEILKQEKEEISKIEKQVELLGGENVSEEDLEKILKDIQREEDEEEKKIDAHAKFIKDREDKKLAIQAALKTGYFARGHSTDTSQSPSSASSTPPVDPYKFTPEKNENAADMKPMEYSPIKVLREKEARAVLAASEKEAKEKEVVVVVKEEIIAEKEAEEIKDKEEAIVEVKAEESIKEEPKKIEPDVVDLEPPQEEIAKVKVEEAAPMEIEDDNKMDEDDEVINDSEEIAAGNITDEMQESDVKVEVKEEIKEEKVDDDVPEPVTEIKKEEEPVEKVVEEEPEVQPTEVLKEIQEENVELNEPAPLEEKPEAMPTPVEIEKEIEIEPRRVSKPVGRRGRRSKKNSEVVSENPEDHESSGQLTAAFSSPASTRPTSPSQDALSSDMQSSEPSTPKLLEQTSLRLKARRSSRQGLQRALKESSSVSNPVSPLSTEEEKEYKAWKKGMLLVWNQISCHKHANIFAGPVSETEAPDYKSIVYDPIDLGAIKRNIESGLIKTTDEFQRDLTLMFFNATMYNSTDHTVHQRTIAMQKDTEKMIREFLNTQALMKASETPKLRAKVETVKVMTSRTRTGSGSQPEDKKKSF